MRAWRTHSCLPLPPIASGSYKYQGLWPFHLRMRSASPCRRNERTDPLSQTLQGHRGLAGGSVFLIRFQAHCLIWPRSQEKRGREVGPDFFYFFFLVCVCMYSEAQQREMSGFCPFFPFLEKRERDWKSNGEKEGEAERLGRLPLQRRLCRNTIPRGRRLCGKSHFPLPAWFPLLLSPQFLPALSFHCTDGSQASHICCGNSHPPFPTGPSVCIMCFFRHGNLFPPSPAPSLAKALSSNSRDPVDIANLFPPPTGSS